MRRQPEMSKRMKREPKKILFIEDDADIQAVGQLALEAVGGFTVMVCSSGREALEGVDEFAPDLILLDVMMPGMDGPSTLAALRERPATRETPVIFMTAKVQPAEIKGYQQLGALNVIAKPFDPMTLSQTIRRMWTDGN
jgi:two-component system OmpR family response regulator